MKFTEAQLEKVFIQLLEEQGHKHVLGETLTRDLQEVLIEDDLKSYLKAHYAKNGITQNEIESIVRELKALPASDLYQSNKSFIEKLTNGFILKRERVQDKDLLIELLDYDALKQIQNTSNLLSMLPKMRLIMKAIIIYTKL